MFNIPTSTGVDDYQNLQTFFDYISENDVGTVDVSGSFVTSQPLVFGRNFAPKTKSVIGRMALRGTGSADALLTIKDWRDGYWQQLELRGPGSTTNYGSRTYACGLLLDDTQRCTFGMIRAESFSFAGILSGIRNTSACDYGNVRAINCGSGARAGSTWYGLITSFTWKENTGTSGSVAQRTVIDVEHLPPNGFGAGFGEFPLFIRIAGRPYYVYGVDAINKNLTIFPWLDDSVAEGQADYIYGGGLCLIGNDSNVASFNMIDALRCGVGLSAASIYGPQGSRLLTQFCGAGVCFGASPGSAGYGTVVRGAYFEANTEDVIVNHRGGNWQYHKIDGEYNLNPDKCVSMGNARLDDNTLSHRFDIPPAGK